MSPYEAAMTMYHREHDRWHQWALFFFAGIGATFYVAGQFRFPLRLASVAAAAISLMWVCAASSIRASTDAWESTLLHFETNPQSKDTAFRFFHHHLDHYDYRADFLKSMQIWRRKTYLSVTRLLVLSGVLAFILFLGLAIAGGRGATLGGP